MLISRRKPIRSTASANTVLPRMPPTFTHTSTVPAAEAVNPISTTILGVHFIKKYSVNTCAKYSVVTSRVTRRMEGTKISLSGLIFLPVSTAAGSVDTALNLMRASVLLMRSRAFFGCFCASQYTDSGTQKITSGMLSAVISAPK